MSSRETSGADQYLTSWARVSLFAFGSKTTRPQIVQVVCILGKEKLAALIGAGKSPRSTALFNERNTDAFSRVF
jgi:hypothetical protein